MNSLLCLHVKKNSLYYILMVIPFTPIEYINSIFPIWASFCSLARILIILILLYRLLVKQRLFSITLGLAILFFIGAFISTYYGGVSLYTLFYNCTYLFGWTLLIEDGVNIDIDAFVKGILFWYEILIYANLLFYIIFPHGYKEGYFLFGNYNTTLRKLFPGIILGAIYAFKSRHKITIRFGCLFMALFLFLTGVGSLTSIIGLLVFAAGMMYYMITKRGGPFKFEYFILISIVLTILFAVLGQFSFAETLLTSIMGKDMTLSARTRIWARTIRQVEKRPILGFGQLSQNYTTTLLGGAIDPHNIFLGTLFYGGIVGIIILAIIMIVSWRRVHECRKEMPLTAMIFDVGFCAYFIMWNFEPFAPINEFYKIFIFIAMACNCMKFASYIKERE